MRPKRLLLLLLELGLGFALTMSAAGCARKTATALNAASACIDAQPDSALTIIRTIDTTHLSSRALRARYALLHAIALDKNWIDTTDVGVVMPAVQYYDRRKPLTSRAKPWYYLGRIQYNDHNYDEAIISFIRAKDYAETMNDNRFKALINQAIADTYRQNHIFDEALSYANAAYKYELLAEDTSLIEGTLFSIAILQNNSKNYAKADSILSHLLHDYTNPHLRSAILSCYAQLSATYEKNYKKSVTLFEQAIAEGNGLDNYNSWGAYAYSLYQAGEQKKSERIFTDMEKAGLKNQFVYQIWKSRIEQMEGNYQQAFYLLDGAIQEQTEGITKLLKQSVIKAQRDYFTLQSEALKKENQLRKWINLLFALTFMALAATAITLVRRYRENVQRKNQQLMETAQELIEQRQAIHALSAEIHHTTQQQIRLRQDLFHFNQESFKELSTLCNTYFKTEGHSSQANSVCGEVRGLLKHLGLGKDLYPILERRINEQFDQMMIHFRAEHPEHREQFFQTTCYLFAGFKTRTIALLLHRDEKDIYQIRWRLKKEIESNPTPHQKDFLTLLNGPES